MIRTLTLGIGVATLSLPTSMIGCVALGIAIDDTAHFLVGHRHRRTQGMPSERAAADCVQALGLPIVTTNNGAAAPWSVPRLAFSLTRRPNSLNASKATRSSRPWCAASW